MSRRTAWVIALLTSLASPLRAATFTVNSTADAPDKSPGDGVCATATGACTLRAAIMETNALAGADTINLPAGFYALTIPGAGENAAATGDLDVTGDLTIAGAGPGVTVVDGGGLDRVFDLQSSASTVEIRGITIQNGSAITAGDGGSNPEGGGLLGRGGALTLKRCVFRDNRANVGGGLLSNGTLVMDESTVSRNETLDVGFTNPEGAGLFVSSGTATITNSTFAGNRTALAGQGNGGAIASPNAGVTITLVNTTLSGNWSRGATFGDQYAAVALLNVTFANNVGAQAINHYSFGDPPQRIAIANTIIANQVGDGCSFTSGTLVDGGHNLESGHSCGFTGPGDLVDTDPLLGPLEDNGGRSQTHALRPGSPAIDAGAGCIDAKGAPLATDQRGSARPAGSACDIGAFESQAAETFTATRTIPILLDVVGGATGAHFTSELTLTNRGTTTASVQLVYTAATSLGASGSGMGTETLAPGQQLVVADAIAYLRGKGVPIPATGNQGGTLRVDFSGLSASDAGFAGARTTSPTGPGRAGLAYAGLTGEGINVPAFLFGLRESQDDRTNLALVNAGTNGPITLKITLFSGKAGDARTFVVPGVPELSPGQWVQINAPQLLRAAGFTNGYALVERVSGVDPFITYAVFNDNTTNDGSYVTPVLRVRPATQKLVPVLVESSTFESELILANPTDRALGATLVYVQSSGPTTGRIGQIEETLAPGEQKIIPQAIQYLRDKGLAVGAKGTATFVGTLAVFFHAVSSGLELDGFAGARTAAPASGGGAYGLFYPSISLANAAASEAWVYGLEQGASTRSNLAFADIGIEGTGGSSLTLRYDLYDGDTGAIVGSEDVALSTGGWLQINGILGRFGGSHTKGYVRVRKVSGDGRFAVYGVVNDGKDSQSGTNDGSYVAMTVVE